MNPANSVSRYRAAINKILVGLDDARNEEMVITSQGGAGTMLDDARDFVGSNADLDKQAIADAINSRNAIETALSGGHYTNLNKMRT